MKKHFQAQMIKRLSRKECKKWELSIIPMGRISQSISLWPRKTSNSM